MEKKNLLITRVKTISERLRVVEKLSCFEITAFFLLCVGEGKKAAISKQEKFSTTLSRSYNAFTLILAMNFCYLIWEIKWCVNQNMISQLLFLQIPSVHVRHNSGILVKNCIQEIRFKLDIR